MFNLKLKFMLAVAILIVGGVSAASAQLVGGTALKFSVATPFVLKDKSFPAGNYTIERTPSSIDAPSLLILRGDHREAMIFDTVASQSAKVADNTELVFDAIGGTNFLTEIRIEGDDVTIEIPKTKRQIQSIAQVSPAEHVLLTKNRGL